MKLIISEKPSTAKIIAHAVGAREKIYGEGKEFCYKGNGYYVVGARGHLYGIGMPQDYGYSKSYKMDELPMFPEFELYPTGEDTENLRNLITHLINLPEVDELICATDAGREGELIFRHIYNANNCTKPVKRLWTNSMTDEAITKCMANLPPDSDFDGEYYAALAREKSDWFIGMNLSRLYSIKDDYAHRIGRVKTPVLAIIVDRDNEISSFEKNTTYRLEMDNGAVSETAFQTKEEAEKARAASNGKDANVQLALSENKRKNRPLLHSLTTLQQEANRVYGLTAKQTLEAAQSLYEKKLITYPRTDCNYVSEDMREQVRHTVDVLGESLEYADRVKAFNEELNLDSRVINNEAMSGHDHHAILPEVNSSSENSLDDTEKKIYGLVANRLLCAVDKEYEYTETNYEFWCEDITYTLKTVKTVEIGWKKYDTEKHSSDNAELNLTTGDTFTPVISVKECVTKPPKHFTDATLLSVMNNIDNRIDDKELKIAVSGKGIGTEATRADIIEQLVLARYIERKDKNIVATEFGREFIASIPDNVKSVERTAEWEQVFTNIKEKGISAEPFLNDVMEFVKSVVDFENSPQRHRQPVKHNGENSRVSVGKCPKCGKTVYEGKTNYYCEAGKDGCKFTLWKEPQFFNDRITVEKATKLINGNTVPLKAISKEGKRYINTDTDTAMKIAAILSGDSIAFSGIIKGDKATITVSGDENAETVRRMAENLKHIDLIEELNRAGFERITLNNGFVNFRNKATGAVEGFDGMEMVRELFEDIENEFFHPTAYRIDLTSDAYNDAYYISRYDTITGGEKSPYTDKYGDMVTFVTVDEAVAYVNENNITVTNPSEEIDDWRNTDSEREDESISTANRRLVELFPMQNNEYPDRFVRNEADNSFVWIFFNPDGDNGDGEFVEKYISEQDIYAAYIASKNSENERNAFVSYLFANCREAVIDTHSGYFEGYAEDYINKPANVTEFYGIAENSKTPDNVAAFINFLEEKCPSVIKDKQAEKSKDVLDITSDNIEIEGYTGTWYVIEAEHIKGKDLFLLESEYYGDEAACLIVDSEKNLVMDDVHNGFADYLEANYVSENQMIVPDEVAQEMWQYGFDVYINGEKLSPFIDGEDERNRQIFAAIENTENIVSAVKEDVSAYHNAESIATTVFEISENYNGTPIAGEPYYLYLDKNYADYEWQDWKKEYNSYQNTMYSLTNGLAQNVEEYLLNVASDTLVVAERERARSNIKLVSLFKTDEQQEISEETSVVEVISYSEQFYEKVNAEYNNFISNIKKESPDVLIQSAAEIVDKDRIRLYLEEYDANLTDEQYKALLSREYPLDEIYEQWTKNGELHGLEDVGIAIEEAADRIMIALEREQPVVAVAEKKPVEYKYINWNGFNEEKYNELVSNVKNHISGSDYAFLFVDKDLQNYQLELNIRELGNEWALDYDIYDNEAEEYIHCGGYYDSAEFPPFSMFISDVEANVKTIFEEKQRLVFMVEQNGETAYFRNDDMTVERLKKECVFADKPFLYAMNNGSRISGVTFAEISQTENGLAVKINVDEKTVRVYNKDYAEEKSFNEIRDEITAADISKVLDLENNNLTFSLVSIDGEDDFVMGGFADSYRVTETDEYINFIDSHDVDNVTVRVDFFSVGNNQLESEDMSEEQVNYVREHLDDVMKMASVLDVQSFDIEPEYEEIEEEPSLLEKAIEYINNYVSREFDLDEPVVSVENLEHVSLGYTELGDDANYPFQVEADLKNFAVNYYINNNLVRSDKYDTLDELVESELEHLEFDYFVAEGNELLETISVGKMPLYTKSISEAKELDERDIYFADRKESEKCASAIDKAISANYNNNRLDTDGVLADVLEDYTFERVVFIVASRVAALDFDGRIDKANIEWAKDVVAQQPDKEGYHLNSHPGLINLLANTVRKELDRVKEQEHIVPETLVRKGFTSNTAPTMNMVDHILRCGSNEPNSLERIVRQFQKNKSVEENAEFLKKEFGEGGRGYIINENSEFRVSAWFNENGITVAVGETAFPSGSKGYVSWEDAAERIQAMLEKGTYCSQEIIDNARNNDIKDIAQKLWHLRQDSNVQPFFIPDYFFDGGFPVSTEKIAEALHGITPLNEIAEGLSDFVDMYERNPEVMRFRFHKPAELLERINDLKAEYNRGRVKFEYPNFKTNADFKFEPEHFITEDEKDWLILRGSGVVGGKFRIQKYFEQENNSKERTDFLKNEYGTGGSGTSTFSSNHDSKGIDLTKGRDGNMCSVEMKWGEVAKRIDTLISAGMYISSKDIEERIRDAKRDISRGNYADSYDKHVMDRAMEVLDEYGIEYEMPQAVIEAKKNTYEIYQIPRGEQYHDLRFLRYEQLEKTGQQPDPKNYEKVYSGSLDDIPYNDKLEGIFTVFNIERPDDFEGHSLSVSDIVVIDDENGRKAFYCDSVGYKDITDIFLNRSAQAKEVLFIYNVKSAFAVFHILDEWAYLRIMPLPLHSQELLHQYRNKYVRESCLSLPVK